MLDHLRDFLTNAQQQKMRQEQKVQKLQEQITYSYERSIDQKSLEDQLVYLQGVGSTIASSKIEEVKKRKERDLNNHKFYTDLINQEKDLLVDRVLQIDAHGSELVEAELSVGGFSEMVVSLYDAGAYDRKDKEKIILTNKEQVHLQMSTPISRNRWKDTCQFTIRKVATT